MPCILGKASTPSCLCDGNLRVRPHRHFPQKASRKHALRTRLTGPLHEPAERLGQFIAAREIDRLAHPDKRVTSNLAALFHAGLFHLALWSALYSYMGEVLRITQQELIFLVGLSRQRVNEALAALQWQASSACNVAGCACSISTAFAATGHGHRPLEPDHRARARVMQKKAAGASTAAAR